jgi:hypothetical protein
MTDQQTLTPEQRNALDKFAAQQGRYWKSKLRTMWMDGRDAQREDGCYLRQVRNQQPPRFLDSYRPTPVTATAAA